MSVHRPFQPPEPLTDNQTTMLCVLGCLHKEGATLKGLVENIRKLDTGIWQPTTEVVLSAVENLERHADVLALDLGRDQVFIITTTGIGRFEALMGAPLPNQGAQRCNAVAIKSAFLDHLASFQQQEILAQLIGYYECELQNLHKSCQDCPMAKSHRRFKPHAQINQIESELKWLSLLTDRLQKPNTPASLAIN